MASAGIIFAVAGLLTAIVVGWLMRESDFEMMVSARSDDGAYPMPRRICIACAGIGLALTALSLSMAMDWNGSTGGLLLIIAMDVGWLALTALGTHRCATTRVIVQNGELMYCSGRKRRRILLRSIESVEIPHYSLVRVRHSDGPPLVLPTFLKGTPRLLATLRDWERRNRTAFAQRPEIVDGRGGG